MRSAKPGYHLKPPHERHVEVAIFQSSPNKGPFYAIKGFFEVNEKWKDRNSFCIFILDNAFYEPAIFHDSSIFQKTRYTQLVIRSMEIEKQIAFDNNNVAFFRKKWATFK